MTKPKNTATDASVARTSQASPGLDEKNVASQLVAATDVQVMQAAELHQLVGQIKAAHFMETVSGLLIAKNYVQARDLLGKLGQVTVRGKDGKPETVSGMERFCELVMPYSARRCRQIVQAVETMGESLYEQAERIGFQVRDYAALRALPPDDQDVVKQAMNSGSREEVVGLLKELASRNEALRAKAVEAEKDLATKDRIIAKDAQRRHADEAEKSRIEAERSIESTALDRVHHNERQWLRATELFTVEADVLMNSPHETVCEANRQALKRVSERFNDMLKKANIRLDPPKAAALATAANESDGS